MKRKDQIWNWLAKTIELTITIQFVFIILAILVLCLFQLFLLWSSYSIGLSYVSVLQVLAI